MTPLLASRIFVFSAYTALILGLFAMVLFRPGVRRRSRWILAAALVFASGVGAFMGSIVQAPSTSYGFSDAVLVLIASPWEIFGAGARVYSLHRSRSRLELALPRSFGPEWTVTGAMVAFLGVLSFACCVRLGFDSAGPGLVVGFLIALGCITLGIVAATSAGRVEFHDAGVRVNSRLWAWDSLGKFEWYADDKGRSILRIQAGAGNPDIQIHHPEDPQIDSVLTRHGLARW